MRSVQRPVRRVHQSSALVATLAADECGPGRLYIATNANPVRITVEAFNNLGIGFVAGIPLPVIYTAVLVILVSLFLNKTRMGRYIYAVGGNLEAVRYSGINVKAVQITVHVLSGFLAAFAGIVLAARMYSGQPAVAKRLGTGCGSRQCLGASASWAARAVWPAP